jgi:hypothetical protein
MQSESHIQQAILEAWGAHPRLRVWRQNTGVAMLGRRAVRFGVPGMPDIFGILAPSGRLIGIECKAARGQQTKEQVCFQAMMERHGAIYVLAKSVDDVDRALAALGVHR